MTPRERDPQNLEFFESTVFNGRYEHSPDCTTASAVYAGIEPTCTDGLAVQPTEAAVHPATRNSECVFDNRPGTNTTASRATGQGGTGIPSLSKEMAYD